MLSGVTGVVNGTLWLSGRSSHRGHVTLLGCNLGQVVYSHCLSSLLRSKKLGYKRGAFGLDRFNYLTRTD